MICPACKGRCYTIADFVRRADDGCTRNVAMKCGQCEGRGEVSDEMVEWIVTGERMRQARLATKRTLREEAKRRGMFPSDLNAMEFGRTKPVEDN